MSMKYWRAGIDDIENSGCTDDEEKILLNAFETIMRRIAGTLARRAEFDLKDFPFAGQGAGHFKLIMIRTAQQKVQQWEGIFESEGKVLKVLGMLQRY